MSCEASLLPPVRPPLPLALSGFRVVYPPTPLARGALRPEYVIFLFLAMISHNGRVWRLKRTPPSTGSEQKRHWTKCEKLKLFCVQTCEQELGHYNMYTAMMYNTLGKLYSKMGRTRQAEEVSWGLEECREVCV